MLRNRTTTSSHLYISSIILPLIILILLTPTCTSAYETTVVVTVTATAPQPASYTDPSVFQDTVMSVSNIYRAAHNATNLIWNDTLASYSQDWAERCQWEHSHGPYGENLAFGYPNASASVEAWGDEEVDYNFQLPTGFTEETGHFTQLVWRATMEVGCAAVNCGYTYDDPGAKDSDGSFTRAQGWYVVCEYYPAGNVMGGSKALGDKGFFKVNVQPSSTYSGPYVTGDSSGGNRLNAAPRYFGAGFVVMYFLDSLW